MSLWTFLQTGYNSMLLRYYPLLQLVSLLLDPLSQAQLDLTLAALERVLAAKGLYKLMPKADFNPILATLAV